VVERILIDTDVLIEYVKGNIELRDMDPCISEITLYEFIRGTNSPKEAKDILEESFQVLYIDNNILLRAVDIWRDLKARGLVIDDRDIIIGATAIEHGIKLLTMNRRHFERLTRYGLTLGDIKVKRGRGG